MSEKGKHKSPQVFALRSTLGKRKYAIHTDNMHGVRCIEKIVALSCAK